MSNRLQRYENRRNQPSTWQLFLPWFLSGFCLLLTSVTHQLALAQEIDSLRKGVVKITATMDGIQKTGTGFIIKHDTQATYIVTAAHVVAGDKYPNVAFFSERHSLIKAEVLQNDARNDISLLKVRDHTQVPPEVSTLPFSTSGVIKDDEELIAIGFPAGGGSWTVVRATLAARQGADLILDGNIDEGNSGGPVLKNGEIVGLITNVDRFGRAIPATFITTVLDGWGITFAEGSQTATSATTAQSSRKDSPASAPPTTKPSTKTRLPFEPDMVVIPAGKFIMGSPETELDRESNEGPQREVSVASFAMSRTEITVGQFRQFVQDHDYHRGNDYQTTAEKNGKGCWTIDLKNEDTKQSPQLYWKNPGYDQYDNHPVVCMSWYDAQAYVQWLSHHTGLKYRLPNEAEWEYAARAGTTAARFYPDDKQCEFSNGFGQEIKSIGDLSWPVENCSDKHVYTAPVASFKPNAWGLFDMLGNVWEWTQDCWHDNYTHAPTDGTAWLEKDGGNCTDRVFRGGAWFGTLQHRRSAFRGKAVPDGVRNIYGFRVARDF